MSVIVNKTAPGAYKIGSLQGEINSDPAIVPSCLSVTATGQSLDIEFAAALAGAEDTALDAVIAAHVVPADLIEASLLPFSDIDGKKLAVHPSYKPLLDDGTTYAVWCGAGDEVDGNGDLLDGGEVSAGPLLHLDCKMADAMKEVMVKFHPANGRIWLHEAYIKFSNAPEKSYISGGIIAMGTPLQQSVNLDLVVTNDIITYAPGGPGTGTHGFADATKIVLMPRTFSNDGDWNYDTVNGLAPVFDSSGAYKMSTVDTVVHRFVNRIPTFGDCPYFSITSDETTELPANFYVRVCAKTTDGSTFAADWHASVVLEIYRQKTL